MVLNRRMMKPSCPSLTYAQLAKAGFFYKPSSSSDDSVTCYLCNKALDGWEAGDNPALEHLSHVPHCGWAINCCIEQHIEDMDRTEEDPLSEKMVEARRATFDEWWPHEAKRGWKCKTKKVSSSSKRVAGSHTEHDTRWLMRAGAILLSQRPTTA